MSEETKEAVRLLIECADQLRRLDPQDGSLDVIKSKVATYLDKQFADAEEAANELCLPL